MKKTFKTFALMLLAAFAFSSCVDVPAPYNLPDKSSNSGSTEDEDAIPISSVMAAQMAIALPDNTTSSETYAVTGYITKIIGAVSKNQQSFWIADHLEDGEIFQAFYANLPDGVSEFKVGMKVKIIGKLYNYVKSAGVGAPEMKNATVVILENGDGGNTSSGDANEIIDFTKGQGSWTINSVSGPEVWTNSSQYGEVASGYDNDKKVCQAAEGWLISPEIDLTNSANSQIVINEAINKIGTGSTVDVQCQVLACLSDDASGASNWLTLTADKRPAGTNWTFQDDTFDASAFDGKKILLAFKYTSTGSSAPSWEIKTVKLKNGQGGGNSGGGSDTSNSSKENPLSVTQAKTASGNNYVKGYIVGFINGMSLATGATFEVPTSAETEILLAETPDETNSDNVFPVQLPTGEIRNALELSAHPNYLKQEVLLYGSVEKYFGVQGMKNTSWAQINGKSFGVDPDGGSGGGNTGDESGTPEGDGSLDNPYNVAAVINYVKGLGTDVVSPQEVYIKGIVKANTTKQSSFDQYGDMTFTMIDSGFENAEFQAYQVLGFGNNKFTAMTDIKQGDEVVVYGKVVYYKGSIPETSKGTAYVYSINGQTQSGDDSGQGGDGGDTPGPGGDAVTELVNGGFEEWVSDTEPLGWKSASSVSSAMVSKSTEARSGTFACVVKPGTGNARLATQEITLTAGSYTFSYYAKSTTSDVCQTYPGYAVIGNATPTYNYPKDDNKKTIYVDINNNEWTLVSYDFDLTKQTTLCLIVMNPKAVEGKTVSQDILVDDATLVKK